MLRPFGLALALLLASCGQSEEGEPPGATPREVLFGVSLPKHVRLGPNGDWVSFTQARGGVRNLWLKPVEGGEARPLTDFAHPGVGPHVWHPEGRYLLYLRQTPGADDVRAYAYDLRTQTSRALSGNLSQQASFIAFSRSLPETVYIATNTRGGGKTDILRVDLASGASLLVHEDSLGALGYVAGPDLTPLIAQVPRDDGGFDWRIRTDDGGWRLWGRVASEDALTTRIENVSSDGEWVYVATSSGRDTTAFARVKAAGRFGDDSQEILAAQDDYDFADASYHRDTGEPFVASFATPRPSFVPLGQNLMPLVFAMRASGSGQLHIVDTDLEAARWLIGHDSASQPVQWGVFDVETSRKIDLFAAQDDMLSQQAAVQPLPVRIGEGAQVLNGLLSLPLGVPRSADGAISKPLAVAIVLRGALASADAWAYSPVHQWLASRGVAVLSLNHRGSVGQGKAHLYPEAGLTAALSEDLAKAAAWLRAQGILKDRLAVLGGGASTHAAAAFEDTALQCKAFVSPAVSMPEALASLPPHLAGLRTHLQTAFQLDIDDPAIPSVPTTVVTGAANRRQAPGTVFTWASEIEQAGTPLTLVTVDRAEERFNQGMDGRAVMAVLEHALADCLGFDAEPMTYADFQGSALTLLSAPDTVKAAFDAATAPPPVSR